MQIALVISNRKDASELSPSLLPLFLLSIKVSRRCVSLPSLPRSRWLRGPFPIVVGGHRNERTIVPTLAPRDP